MIADAYEVVIPVLCLAPCVWFPAALILILATIVEAVRWHLIVGPPPPVDFDELIAAYPPPPGTVVAYMEPRPWLS